MKKASMVKFSLSTLPSMLLIKWPRYKPFPCKLPTISNHAKETFFMESVFTKVKYSGLQGCSVREKETFSQRFCVIYKILEHYFLTRHFQNVFVVQSLIWKQAVDCIPATVLKGNSTTCVFLIIFQSFRRISKHTHEIMCDGVQQGSGLQTIVLCILKTPKE